MTDVSLRDRQLYTENLGDGYIPQTILEGILYSMGIVGYESNGFVCSEYLQESTAHQEAYFVALLEWNLFYRCVDDPEGEVCKIQVLCYWLQYIFAFIYIFLECQ